MVARGANDGITWSGPNWKTGQESRVLKMGNAAVWDTPR